MRHLSIIFCLGLVACGPGLEDLPNIDEVDVAPDAGTIDALSTENTTSETVLGALLSDEAEADRNDVDVAASGNSRAFGLLRRLGGGARSAALPEESVAGEEAEELIQAALPDATERKETEPAEITRGTVLPYGSLARACGLRRAELGKEVARFPEHGSGYRLYDSNPSSTALRTHYVTGFKDGCARQFTAALALFGSTETHEVVRYDSSNRDLAYTETDLAYEQLKSRVCRVRKQTPCSERRRNALDRDTVFLSVYERFASNPRWADMLLHDGEVLAKDLKER